MKRSSVLFFLLGAIAFPVFAEDLVVDGGFELPLPGDKLYRTFPAGTNFGSWLISGGSVDVVTTNQFFTAGGNQALDLNGEGSGAVYQTISTKAGVVYRLSFAFAGNPCPWCGSLIKRMEVKWGDTVLARLAHDVTGRPTTEVGWRRFSFLVTGTGNDRLSFRSLNAGLAGPALDEVSLVANSEPEVFAGLTIRKAVELSFPTAVGKRYQVEWAPDPAAAVWNLLGPPLPGNGTTNTVWDPREDPVKVYRVLQLPE